MNMSIVSVEILQIGMGVLHCDITIFVTMPIYLDYSA